MVAGKENVGNLVFCSVAPSVMSSGDLGSQNCFRFVLLVRVGFAQKVRDQPSPFFTPAARPTGVDDSCEIVSLTYPSRDVTMGTNFRHFRTFSAGLDAIFVLLSLHSFDLL